MEEQFSFCRIFCSFETHYSKILFLQIVTGVQLKIHWYIKKLVSCKMTTDRFLKKKTFLVLTYPLILYSHLKHINKHLLVKPSSSSRSSLEQKLKIMIPQSCLLSDILMKLMLPILVLCCLY